MVYLDNAATTKLDRAVLDEMVPYLTDEYGNPGSLHALGIKAREAVDDARRRIAAVIGAQPQEIIFTSGATEANNLVLSSIALQSGSIAIVSTLEHPAVLRPFDHSLMHRGRFVMAMADGIVYADDVEGAIRSAVYGGSFEGYSPAIVSVMAENNEIGTYPEIDKIAAACAKSNVAFHTDATQGFTTIPFNMAAQPIDFLSVSAHKFHGPRGIGFLYARDAVRPMLTPSIYGGGQEFGLRSGTENVAGIVGMAKAVELAAENRDVVKANGLLLTEIVIGALQRELPEVYRINGFPSFDSPIRSIRFRDVDGESLVLLLSSMGVMVSAGSACSSNEATPSHVLKAIGLTDKEARSSIRLSVSRFTTEEELKEAAEKIVRAVRILRGE